MLRTKKSKPRISVNKLAEYLEANPNRRKQIVIDAKYPKNFIVTRYKDARDAMKSFLIGEIDEDVLIQVSEEITNREAETEFQDQDNRLSGEAIESFLISDIVILDGCLITDYRDDNQLVEISNVDVSVNPDLVVKKEVEGVTHVGAIKLHISKTNLLSEESQKIVSVLLYKYADNYIKSDGESASLKMCFSFDVFNQKIECCPTAFKMRLKKIEAACEEIALWWDTL